MAKAQKKVIALPKEQKVSTEQMLGKVNMLILRCHHFQAERRISQDQIKAEDAEKGWVKGQKKLVDSSKLKEINSVLHVTRAFLKSVALPSPIADSVYFIPKVRVERVEKQLNEYKEKHRALVEAYAEEQYEADVKEAKKALGKLFNPADYVAKEYIRSLFGMDWEYRSYEVPVDLEGKIYKRELAKAEKNAEAAAEAWKTMLRSEFMGVVSHLVERLKPSKDGKKKVLRDAPFTNMAEWIGDFGPRNIVNDVQLKAVVETGNKLLKGLNPEALRDDDNARAQAQAAFQTIKNTLDTMVSVKPSREVSFEED